MKKLSIAAAVLSLSIAAPVFACPGMEGHEETPKTAEKAKEAPAPAPTTAKAKDDKAAPAPSKDTAKAKPAPAKPGDKVSQK